jgi:hypothetical protein
MSEKNLKIRNKFVDKIINKIEKINDDIKLLSKVDKKLFKNENNLIGGTDLPLGPPDWPPDDYERGQPPPPDGTNHIRPNLSRAQFKTAEIDRRAKKQELDFARLKATTDANKQSIAELGQVNTQLDEVELKVGDLANSLDRIKLVTIDNIDTLDIKDYIENFQAALGDEKYLFDDVLQASTCVLQYDVIWQTWSTKLIDTLKSVGGNNPFNLEYAYYIAKQDIPDYNTVIKQPATNPNFNLIYKKFRTKLEYDWWFPDGKFYKEYLKLNAQYNSAFALLMTTPGTILTTLILENTFTNAINSYITKAAQDAHTSAMLYAEATKNELFQPYVSASLSAGHEDILRATIVKAVMYVSVYAPTFITNAEAGDTTLTKASLADKVKLSIDSTTQFTLLYSDSSPTITAINPADNKLIHDNVVNIAIAVVKKNNTDIKQALANIGKLSSQNGLDKEALNKLEKAINKYMYKGAITLRNLIETRAIQLIDILPTAITPQVLILIVNAAKDEKDAVALGKYALPQAKLNLATTVRNFLLIYDIYIESPASPLILDPIVDALFDIIESFPVETSTEVIVAIMFAFVANRANMTYMALPLSIPPRVSQIMNGTPIKMVIRNPFTFAILVEVVAIIMLSIAKNRAKIISETSSVANAIDNVKPKTIEKETIAAAVAAIITAQALDVIAKTIIPKTNSNYNDLTQNLKSIIPLEKFFYYFPLTLVEKDKQDILEKYYIQRNSNLATFNLDDDLKFEQGEFTYAKGQSILHLANMAKPITSPLPNPPYKNWAPTQVELDNLFEIE